jgi:DNA topoisomerase-2
LQKNEIKLLSDREHVLLRPARYVGSIQTENVKQWDFDIITNKFSYIDKDTNIAFKKIFREILDNSIDEYVRTTGKFSNKIKITINQKKNEILLEDNGRGIPFSEHKEGRKKITGAELAWTRLKAGSNFDDSDDNKTLGQNGEGASLTNILSTSFKGETCDGNKKITVHCTDNMSNIKSSISSGTKKFTRVTIQPDLEKFNLDKIPDFFISSIIVDFKTLIQVYSKLEIIFTHIDINNKKKILTFNSKTENFKGFIESFVMNKVDEDENNIPLKELYEVIEVDGLKIGIFENNSDSENTFHTINGLLVLSGSPLNWVINSISKPLLEKMVKKHKNIKIGDFRQKLSFIVIFTKMTNPRFNSQTKESCVNTFTDFKNNIELPNFSSLSEKIYKKRKNILESLTLSQSIADMVMDKKALKNLKPELKKRVLIEKYYKSSGDFKKDKISLVLAEGDSALGSVLDLHETFPRSHYSFFPLKGKPLNTYECTNNKISSNQKIKDILQILEMDITKDKPTMKYDSIIIATDADADGQHISGLLLALFWKFTPNLVKENKIKVFLTPMVVATNKKTQKKELLFSFQELNQFEKNNNSDNFNLFYYKGLGSWNSEELDEIIKKNKSKISFIVPFGLNDMTEECVNILIGNWFMKETTDFRKHKIENNIFDINKA